MNIYIRFGIYVHLLRLSVLLCALLAGCAFNSDASITLGFRGSPEWIKDAPRQDVETYFDGIPVSELCWSLYYESGAEKSRLRREVILSEIERSLERRGLGMSGCDTYPPLNRVR